MPKSSKVAPTKQRVCFPLTRLRRVAAMGHITLAMLASLCVCKAAALPGGARSCIVMDVISRKLCSGNV